MGKGRNSIIISGILVAFLVGTIVSSPSASAANPVLTFLQENVIAKFQEVLDAIDGVETNLPLATQTQIDNIETETNKIQMMKDDVGLIKAETDKIQMMKDDVSMIKTDVSNIETEIVSLDLSSIQLAIEDLFQITGDGLNQLAFDVGLIKAETDKIQMVKDDVGLIKAETDKIQMVKDDVGLIKAETDKIQMVKDDVGLIKAETDKISDIKTETDKIQMVKDDVIDIKTTVNNLDKSFSQVKTSRVASHLASLDKIQCTSDKDFVVHIFLALSSGASYFLQHPGQTLGMTDAKGFLQSYTIGGIGGNTVIVDTTSTSSFIGGQLALQTTSDAIASCADVP